MDSRQSSSGFDHVFQRRQLVIVLILFLLSMLPRSLNLDLYFTVDEDTYLNRSYRFLQALMRQDWSGTFANDATPGITTQWAGALGILAYYLPQAARDTSGLQFTGESVPEADRKSTALMASTRYPVVLLSSLFVVGAYLLLRRGLSQRIALLAALFLAFDPFFISLSRVLGNDAPYAIFVVFAVLCLGLAWQIRARWWLVASGASTGLAVLSKSPALVLVPLVIVVPVVLYRFQSPARRGWRSLLIDWAIWFGSMSLAIFVFWPSMWTQPLDTFRRVLEIAADKVDHGNYEGTYFWGQPRLDPGPFFYPAAILLRTTPPVLFGAVVACVSAAGRLRNLPRKALDATAGWLLILAAIPAVYLAIMSLAARKSERLILPVFLALDILGAIGCLILLDRIAARWSGNKRRLALGLACGALGLLPVASCVSTHPYYFSFYNPLLGGAQTASKVLPLGWGEGLEQAGRYLDAKENAEHLRVGVRWDLLFRKYFRGSTKGFPPRRTPQRYWPVELDYGIIYASDWQMFGVPRTFKELCSTPEMVVRINGVDYVSVYKIPELRSLPPEATALPVQYENGLALVGYRSYPVELDETRNRQMLPMTLYWHVGQACPRDYRIAFSLVDSAGMAWGASEIDPPCAGWKDTWQSDQLLPDEVNVPIDEGAPSGAYSVEMRAPERRQIAPAAESPVRLGPIEVPRHLGLTAQALMMADTVNARLSRQAMRLGYGLAGEMQGPIIQSHGGK